MVASQYGITDGGSNKGVQDRLLDAAEALFCERGFEGTSVRDITSKAKCNVAAINYHFGGKENLYKEVFHHHMRVLRNVRIASINSVMSQSQGEVTLEQLLHAFAVAFIEPLLDVSQGRRFMKLMIREMLNPRLPKRMFAEEVAVPTITALGRAIATVNPGLGQKETVMCIISVIGQLIHAIHLSEMFGVDEDIGLPMPNLAEMVDHVVGFSVAGVRAMVKEAGR